MAGGRGAGRGGGGGWRGSGSRVAAEGMAGGDLDENNLHPVGVLDRHLDQSPGLGLWLLQHADARGGQPRMLSSDIAALDPDHQGPSGTAGTAAGNLQEPRAEEEHHPRIGRGTELPVDLQAQHVAVETPALIQIGGPQQDSAAQDVHASILTVRWGAGDTPAAGPAGQSFPRPVPASLLAAARQCALLAARSISGGKRQDEGVAASPSAMKRCQTGTSRAAWTSRPARRSWTAEKSTPRTCSPLPAVPVSPVSRLRSPDPPPGRERAARRPARQPTPHSG